MANYDYDVLYIGSGHAAWHGALIILNKKVRYFIKRLKREEAEEKS